MTKLSRRRLLAAVALPALAGPALAPPVRAQGGAPAGGTTLHVLSSGAFTAAYQRLAPLFEKQTGHRLVSAYGASFGPAPDALPQRLARNDPADVVLALDDALEALAKAGHLDGASITRLAETRVAFAVRSGTPLPDMSTEAAMREALLAAPSIAFSPSGSGRYYETELVQRLGIADQVLPKSRRWFPDRIGAVVARGDAALGLQQVSELLPIPGIEIIRIPESLQKVAFAAAAIGSRSQQPAAARELIAFLAAPPAAPLIAETGLDPLKR
jgi:molybdate transport system substrate-binding protein